MRAKTALHAGAARDSLIIMIVYKFDGTRDGILCCVYRSFVNKEEVSAIFSTYYEPDFTTEVYEVETDLSIARRVRSGIAKRCGISLLNELFFAMRSYDYSKEYVIFALICRSLKERRNVISDYAYPPAAMFYDRCRAIRNEAHRMLGFIRFYECEGGGLYAPFEPDNDVIDMIAPHFCKRLKEEKFILHDVRRARFAAYDGKMLKYGVIRGKPIVRLSAEQTAFSTLWKTYFSAVTIKPRLNKRAQANFLPHRYRKFMTEFE